MNDSIGQYFREHGDVRVRSIGHLLSDDIIDTIIDTHVEYVLDTIPDEPDVRDSLRGRGGFLADAHREQFPLLAMVETALMASQNYPIIGQLACASSEALDALLKVGLMLQELGTYDKLKN
jgi:hypothetical protein